MNDVAIQELTEQLRKEEVANNKRTELTVSLEELTRVALAYEGEDRIISSLEIYERLKKEPPQVGISSGFGKLDEILRGFFPKQLITVSGPTKNGKTQFCIELTSRMKEYHPLWLPFE